MQGGKPVPNDARESVTVLAIRLLRWVRLETISDLVAEAKSQFAVLFDERFGAA